MRPIVSIIIVTYNQEKNIADCLTAIQNQDYPKSKYEIIIVDDKSTDKTIEISRSYGAQVILSGKKHIEKSKSLGIEKSRGKYILFIDADIILVEKDIISLCVDSCDRYPEAIGAQVVRWQYSIDHTLCDRYCELFGVNDPFVYMLGKRGVLSPSEKIWMDKSVLIEQEENHSIAIFTEKNLRTFGSQGFMIRTSYLKQVNWKPYFFHLDIVSELVSQGHGQIILINRSVRHRYVDSMIQFHQKLARNIQLYYQYKKYRTYSYGISSFRFFLTLLAMFTIGIPLFQSIRGYTKKRDSAWFLHPLFCITVPIIYMFHSIKWYLQMK